MTQGHGFDWRTLGKADYSQAAALVASLPEEKRICLRGVSRELLVRLVHLSWRFAQKSGRGVAYCWPSLRTIAFYLKRSERTVERHLIVLRNAGLISYQRRVDKFGAWTSNLYQMGRDFMAMLFARKSKKVQSFWDPTFLSDNNLKKGYNAGAGTATSVYNPPDWMKANATSDIASTEASPRSSDGGKGTGGQTVHRPSRHEIVYVPRGAHDDVDVDARKALLKRQAEALKARGL